MEDIVREGRCLVNGAVVRDLSFRVGPGDVVEVDGRAVDVSGSAGSVWMLNKPPGYLCTRQDPRGRPTVFDLATHLQPPFQCVGRLDANSRGLLLICDDGQLANRLMHPRYEIEKIYEVRARGVWLPEFVGRLGEGVQMREGGIGRARVLQQRRVVDNGHQLRLALTGGKKREIRYSLAALGMEVEDLCRVELAGLQLGKLSEGKARRLDEGELAQLRGLVKS